MKNILFLNGVPDNRSVIGKKIEKSGNVIWEFNGSAHVSKYLQDQSFNRMNVLFDTRQDQELPRQMIHGVFNEISDPDTHKIALQKAEDFYKAVSGHVPFFNIPSHVMRTTRDNISRLLQGIDKLHVPKTLMIQPKRPSEIHEVIKKEGFTYPVIFRQAGDHGGISTIRVDDKSEEFHAFALDERDYYLTQFVEYAQDDIYTFYRLVVVDGEVFISHVFISKEWMVHHKNQLDEKESHDIKEEVAKTFTTKIKPQIQPTITEIYKRLGLDYFCMDCNIDPNMNILVFEINVNIVFQDKNENIIFSEHLEKIREALIKMITGNRPNG